MSYDVTIRRGGSDAPAISLAEWEEMRLRFPAMNEVAYFDETRGEIVVKNPPQQVLAQVLEVAELLGAEAEGDDGEFYTYDAPSVSASVRTRATAGDESLLWSLFKFAAVGLTLGVLLLLVLLFLAR